jgi:hypothetical protein
MGQIHLTNSKGLPAVVATRRVAGRLQLHWIDAAGRPAHSVRICRAPLEHDLAALLRRQAPPAAGADPLATLGAALVAGDPELDLERTGGFLTHTSRVYVDSEQQLRHRVATVDIIRNSDGSERERRPHQVAEQNLATKIPLRYSGKLRKKSEVWNRFVFAHKLQLVHENALSYHFLFEMARELELADSLLDVGAGAKANQPLILQRGGTPYRGFLEGRTRGKSYCLILHLANLELKVPSNSPAKVERSPS